MISIGWMILVALALLLLASIPADPHRRTRQGWAPGGFVFLILVIFWLLGVL